MVRRDSEEEEREEGEVRSIITPLISEGMKGGR